MQMMPTAPLPSGNAVRTASRNGHHSPDVYGPSGRSPWLDIDWREHQRWVMVEGRPVNVIELGEGPPLVFVHGLIGSWPNWLEQLPVLAAEHRVIAFDLPGFGRSPMPVEKISILGYARLLDVLLSTLGVDAAPIVAHSTGGCVVTELAIASPRRVERLMLAAPAGISTRAYRIYLPALHRSERVLMASTALAATNADLIARRPRLRGVALSTLASHPTLLSAPMAAELIRGAGKPGFVPALEALSSYYIGDRLPEIGCPTLIAWGDRDRTVSVRDADIFAELIPESRKVVFEDTAHLAMLERPDAFNALLTEFLSE